MTSMVMTRGAQEFDEPDVQALGAAEVDDRADHGDVDLALVGERVLVRKVEGGVGEPVGLDAHAPAHEYGKRDCCIKATTALGS
jgi:hypothetical protein